MDQPAAKPFQLYGDHPALDLVNTFDMRFSGEPIEKLVTYADLLRFVVQLGLLPADQGHKLSRSVPEREAKRVLASVRELREVLSLVFYALAGGGHPGPAPVKSLETFFHAAASQRRLQPGRPQLHWRWPSSGLAAETPLWLLAQSAADLLVSPHAELVKECGDPTCRWLFLDISKNHTRRWCDMKTCGNRMKARRFQARQQQNSP